MRTLIPASGRGVRITCSLLLGNQTCRIGPRQHGRCRGRSHGHRAPFSTIFSMANDLRYALRMLRVHPGFAFVAILCLALGTGANAAIFQLLDAVRLRDLPVAAPEELVQLRVGDMTDARGNWLRDAALTNPLWEHIRNERQIFSGLFAWADERLEVSSNGQSRKLAALWVSGDFFRVLGVQAQRGRVFTNADDYRGCGLRAGVVVSDGFWRREFGGDPSIVGKQVSFGKYRAEVLGIAPQQFSGLEVGKTFDVAMPLCAEPAWHGENTRLDSGTVWWLTVMARRKPGVSTEQAAAVMQTRSAAIFEASLPPAYPPESVKPFLAMTLVTEPALKGISHLREQYSRPLVFLLAITALVLLIACTNIAHLMLARASARRREMAVRLAVGASRLRLARQLITESLALATSGLAIGLVLARIAARVLVAFLTTDSASVFLDLSFDVRTFAFAAALLLVTCVVFASGPIFRLMRTETGTSLTVAGRGVTSDRERSGGRRALLASQIAVSLALLVGTLLFVRSLRGLNILDAGFERHGLLVATLSDSDTTLSPDGAVMFRRELLARIRATAHVDAAAEAMIVPLTRENWNNRVWVDGSDAAHSRVAMRNMVGTEYFKTIRTPLIAGREFDDHDLTPSSRPVAVVNEALVGELGLRTHAVGQRLWVEDTPFEPRTAYEIVGIVKNTKYGDLREEFEPTMFLPLSSTALERLKSTGGAFIIRSSASTDAAMSSIRNTFAAAGPHVRYSFRVLDTLVGESLLKERLMATLGGTFGALAVVLTALGLYGVTSYTVAQRTQEIGIRMAIGAEPRGILFLILHETGVVLALGLGAGTLLTLAVGRTAGALLFGVRPYDPVSLVIGGCSLALVAVAASYVPARRAGNVDPVIALRSE
jgi:putative ABC transport system permease protein